MFGFVNAGNVGSSDEEENEAGPNNEQVVSGNDAETPKTSGSSRDDTPSVATKTRIPLTAVGTRAKLRKAGEVYESVAGSVSSMALSVDSLVQVMAQKGSSIAGISSIKEEMNATNKSIDELNLLVISALKR